LEATSYWASHSLPVNMQAHAQWAQLGCPGTQERRHFCLSPVLPKWPATKCAWMSPGPWQPWQDAATHAPQPSLAPVDPVRRWTVPAGKDCTRVCETSLLSIKKLLVLVAVQAHDFTLQQESSLPSGAERFNKQCSFPAQTPKHSGAEPELGCLHFLKAMHTPGQVIGWGVEKACKQLEEAECTTNVPGPAYTAATDAMQFQGSTTP
jgi:hypothetical protein